MFNGIILENRIYDRSTYRFLPSEKWNPMYLMRRMKGYIKSEYSPGSSVDQYNHGSLHNFKKDTQKYLSWLNIC